MKKIKDRTNSKKREEKKDSKKSSILTVLGQKKGKKLWTVLRKKCWTVIRKNGR
jgi:hypothetical protein